MFGRIFINGLLNGMALLTVQPQNTMRFILHIPTELPIGLIFTSRFIYRGVPSMVPVTISGILLPMVVVSEDGSVHLTASELPCLPYNGRGVSSLISHGGLSRFYQMVILNG